MSSGCGEKSRYSIAGQDSASAAEAPDAEPSISASGTAGDAHRGKDEEHTTISRASAGSRRPVLSGSRPKGSVAEVKNVLEEADRGNFSFRKINRSFPYQRYIGDEECLDRVPENTDCALRGLSEEELGRRGPHGSLLHLLVRRYGAALPETALDLFPTSAVSARDEHGQTVLHAIAAFGGRAATLERVMQRIGLEALAIPSVNGTLPLHLAAMNSLRWWPSAVLEAVGQEAIAPQTAQGANLLHCLAAALGGQDSVGFFVEKLPKECLMQKDAQGRTPLHTAAASRHRSALPLIEASPVEVLSMADNQGCCPLELALLRDQRGRVLCTSEVVLALIDAYVKMGVMETKKEWQVASPLHVALDCCSQTVIDALLACPQARDWAMIPDPETGVLPIHYVVGKYKLFERLDIGPLLELLTPEDVATPILGSTRTALHLAVILDDSSSGMQLLDVAGASFDVDALDAKGRSLLMLGLTKGSPRKRGPVELLRRVVDLSESDCPLTVSNWRSLNVDVDASLLVAICSRYERTFFERTTADVWEGGLTPLSCACYQLHKSVPFQIGDDEEGYRRDLATLLELVPEWFVTVRGRNGYTPLHSAAACGNAIAVELLLQLPSGGRAAEMVVEALNPGHSGTPLEAAMKGAHIGVVREFLTKLPGVRSIRTVQGETLAQLAESLYSTHPELYAEVKAAFAPSVKSAAC